MSVTIHKAPIAPRHLSRCRLQQEMITSNNTVIITHNIRSRNTFTECPTMHLDTITISNSRIIVK